MAISAEAQVERAPEVAQARDRVTSRTVVLGLLTILGMVLYISYFGRGLIRSYLPVAVMLPFVAWVGVNTVLKLTVPRFALSRIELLTIFSMTWVVGNLPTIGWAGFWVTDLTAPAHWGSPENRVGDLVVPFLPQWLFPETSPRVIGRLYTGLEPGESIPWGAWVRPLYWWLTGCLAMVMAGFFASVLFFKQWAEKERLVFPMAAFPLELLRESEGKRLPVVFTDRVFWAGFAIVAGIICWNIAGYFVLSMPRITLFDQIKTKAVHLGYHFPDYYLRVRPMLMGLAYLCPLDILFSFWVVQFVNIFKEGMINRTGFTVGLEGQAATAKEITMLEAHGALVFLVVWSVWVAREHLRETFRRAFSGSGSADDGAPVSYRTAWLGLLLSAVFVGGWLLSAGMSFPATVAQMLLMFVCFFGITKYAAITGFVFLSSGEWGKGAGIMKALAGTASFSPRTQTAMWLFSDGQSLLGLPIRTTSIVSIPHFFRMLGEHLRRHPLIWGAVPLAFVTGYFASSGVQLYRCYTEGALNGLVARWDWKVLLWRVPEIEGTRLTFFDSQKLGVWLLGGAGAGLLTYLRARFAWWPFHPAALAFPTLYGFSIFLVWLPKFFVLRFGGVLLYRRSLPFWYGVIVGYLFGIGVSGVVDAIWFPGQGHYVHEW